jgi:hypothetical protein
MQSSGRLSKLMPVKDGGTVKTVLIEQEGPIAFIESTTLTQVFDEDENRCLELRTDEGPEQTAKIIAQTAAGYQDPSQDGATDRRVQVHHALQRMLQMLPVRVPFATRLAGLFPTDRIEIRRAFTFLLRLVEVSALLHQRQREIDDRGNLIATPEDYGLAQRLMAKPFARLVGDPVPDRARRLHEQLVAKWRPEPGGNAPCFTAADVMRLNLGSKSSMHLWLKQLEEAGAIRMVERGQGRKPASWQLTSVAFPDVPALPSVADVCGPKVPASEPSTEDRPTASWN